MWPCQLRSLFLIRVGIVIGVKKRERTEGKRRFLFTVRPPCFSKTTRSTYRVCLPFCGSLVSRSPRCRLQPCRGILLPLLGSLLSRSPLSRLTPCRRIPLPLLGSLLSGPPLSRLTPHYGFPLPLLGSLLSGPPLSRLTPCRRI